MRTQGEHPPQIVGKYAFLSHMAICSHGVSLPPLGDDEGVRTQSACMAS